MRSLSSEFVQRDTSGEVPEIFSSPEKVVPTPEPRPLVVRTKTGESNPVRFDRSPESRRESILVLLGRMATQDGSAAVDSLLLDAIRYFRPAA